MYTLLLFSHYNIFFTGLKPTLNYSRRVERSPNLPAALRLLNQSYLHVHLIARDVDELSTSHQSQQGWLPDHLSSTTGI